MCITIKWKKLPELHSEPGSNQALGISVGLVAVHFLEGRVVDQRGVNVNLSYDVSGCSIGNHDLLRGGERNNEEQAGKEEGKAVWSPSEIENGE